MKQSFHKIMVCPICRSALALEVTSGTDEMVESGILTCYGCGTTFPIRNGIPIMLSDKLPNMASKLREANGWAAMSKDQGWYIPSETIDLALPDVVGKLGWNLEEASSWAATDFSFDQMMQDYVRPGMRVLEIGAAKTWAGRYFLDQGCEYVGCDMMEDPNIGIGRSRFFAEHFGHYEVTAADGEALPFADRTFDLVFAIAALHHALDLPKMLSEMARVTRRGGIVAGLNEGVRRFGASPNNELQEQEKGYGINEHVHSIGGYWKAFSRCGLLVTRISRSIGYDKIIGEKIQRRAKQLERIPVIGDWAAAVAVVGLFHEYDGVTLYARKLL